MHNRACGILLALLVAAGLCAIAAAPAIAARRPPSGGSSAPAKSTQRSKEPGAAEGAAKKQILSPEGVGAGTLAKELGSTGQVDPLSGLGIRNPVCDQLAQIRSRQTRLACESSGAPESNYPASNYGFDIFISTGITHPIGDFTAAFVTILNGIWLGLIFVLKLTLSLLGLAFGLNPFSEGQTMSQISAAVSRMYAQITDPWLSTLIVCGGIWFAYKGLLKREVAAGVGGTLAAIAMVVLGLWVVHQPRETVGRLATLSDEVALGAISAPQSGSMARPVGTYAEAMSQTWSRLVEVPFAGLDFSDLQWALGPPPPEAVEKSDEHFCEDFGAVALLAVLSHLGSEGAKQACTELAAKRYGKPQRVIDLYLRSSPGSAARQALWDYFDNNENYKAKVAAQGGDGVLTRLSMLALFALGLLGAILLLAWLAIRLFTQAAIAFVLLLAAPFALFLPMLGDSGRQAFKTWGLTLLGSILAKVIYAVFLSIVLLGISILGAVSGPGGSATGFLLSCAFSWAVFLKRTELVAWLKVGESERFARGGGFGVGDFAGLTLARGISRRAGGSLRGVARRGVSWNRASTAEGARATHQSAHESLRGSARALAEQRYREASETVKAGQAKPSLGRVDANRAKDSASGDPKSARGAVKDAAAQVSKAKGRSSPVKPTPPHNDFYRQAQELISRADRNQSRDGQRWSERDLRRFEREDRALLRSSSDPADHAHRAGYERARFEELKGPERERAEQEIEKARKRDAKRLALISEQPGRIVGRSRQAAERARQGIDQLAGTGDRREQLRRLRRERRDRDHRPSRRNLSRGG